MYLSCRFVVKWCYSNFIAMLVDFWQRQRIIQKAFYIYRRPRYLGNSANAFDTCCVCNAAHKQEEGIVYC